MNGSIVRCEANAEEDRGDMNSLKRLTGCASRNVHPALPKVSGPVPIPLRNKFKCPSSSVKVAARGPIVVTVPSVSMFHPQTSEFQTVTRFSVTTANDTTARHLVVPCAALGGGLRERSINLFRKVGSLAISLLVQ